MAQISVKTETISEAELNLKSANAYLRDLNAAQNLLIVAQCIPGGQGCKEAEGVADDVSDRLKHMGKVLESLAQSMGVSLSNYETTENQNETSYRK